jgi:hypothetical protein
VCCFVPAGRLKLRDGPVLVAKSTEQVPPDVVQVAAVVLVYQDRPWSTWLGSASHCSVPNGSNAFGQPFQPAFAPVWPVQVCQVFSRSGWPQSVPPSRTPTVTP